MVNPLRPHERNLHAAEKGSATKREILPHISYPRNHSEAEEMWTLWQESCHLQCRKCVVALHVDCLAALHSKWTEMPPSRCVLGWYNGLGQYSPLLGTDITSNNTDTKILSHWITHYYYCLCVAVSIIMAWDVTTQWFISGVFRVACAQLLFKRTPGYLSNQ